MSKYTVIAFTITKKLKLRSNFSRKLLKDYQDRTFGEICYGLTKMEFFTKIVPKMLTAFLLGAFCQTNS